MQKQHPNLQFEKSARQRGFQAIAGVDEAGRGPLAGPVVVAACILPEGFELEGINDSKKLTPLQRYELYEKIVNHPDISFSVEQVEALRIDQINILQATFEAMLLAVASLPKKADYLLVDGSLLPRFSQPAEAIIGGDGLSQSIAAASIIAKETRDRLMIKYHERFPQYGFHQHKGYGTQKHLEAIRMHGTCPLHRLTFHPCSAGAFNG